jgi:hypothetical protein
MTYPPEAVPEAPFTAQTSWATSAVPSAPVVGSIPATNEVPETPDPILSPGAQDAKADDVSATVAGAVAAAQSRYMAHQQDTFAQGSQIGTPMTLPPSLNDPAVGSLGRPDWRVDAGDEPVPG